MDPQNAQLLSETLIVCDNHASIAESSEILTGKEREAANLASGAGYPAQAITRADGLGRIFDHGNSSLFGNTEDGIKIHTATEQMDRQNGLSACGDSGRDSGSIEVKGGQIDIDKNR